MQAILVLATTTQVYLTNVQLKALIMLSQWSDGEPKMEKTFGLSRIPGVQPGEPMDLSR
jgi:hypothetical protein